MPLHINPPPGRFVLNRDVVRLDGQTPLFAIRTRPDIAFEIPHDLVGMLTAFHQPSTLQDVFGPSLAANAHAVLELVKHGILLPEEDGDRTLAARRQNVLPRFAHSPPWDSRSTWSGAVAILGVRHDRHTLSRYSAGSADAPRAIRHASGYLPLRYDFESGAPIGLFDSDSQRVIAEGIGFCDAGDIVPSPACRWEDLCRAVSASVLDVVRTGAFPIVLGGDHTVTLAVLPGLGSKKLGVIHIDAHSDCAPIRFPGDLHHGNVMSHVSELESVSDILHIGVRGLQPRPLFGSSGKARIISLQQLRSLSLDTLRSLCRDDLPYYVSMDVDALDPSTMPATGSPVNGGLGLFEMRMLLTTLLTGREVLGADVVELLPVCDSRCLGATAAVDLIFSVADVAVRRP